MIVLAATISTAVFLSGCVTSSGSYCDIAKAVQPHSTDVLSEATKRDMLTELEKLEQLCGVRP